jgi:glycine cleavage system H lipoate-binding protein
MDTLLAAFQWMAIVVGGLLLRAGVAILVLAAVVAVVTPVMFAFEGGRRLLLRLRGLEQVHGFEWRRALYYAPRHVWLAASGPAVRLGLDSMAARVLLDAERIELPAAGTRVPAGAALARITAGGRLVTLPSPIDGVVTEANVELTSSPELAVRHPYTGGWLVEMKPATSAYEAFPRAARALAWFKDEASRLTFALEHAHGYAAADGGVPIHPGHPRLEDGDLGRIAGEFLGATVDQRD